MATEAKLSRVSVNVSNLKQLTDEDLMTEIKDVLGYGEVDKALELKKIAAIFSDLDIEPFSVQKVQAYKKEKAASLNRVRYTGWGDRVTTRGVWLRYQLRGYQKAVPAFALLRAAQVQKALNAANIQGTFFVEELTKRHTKTVVDPFMILEAAGKRFYLDVWDEPKFEGRRTR